MAFLRIESKPSGTYLRIVESYKEHGKSRHRTLHSLGKVEDYPPDQLQRIASKLLELSGCRIEDIIKEDLKEISRVNYGYALVIKSLVKTLKLDSWMKKVNLSSRIRFDWMSTLELMIAERLNEPCSKRATFFHQNEYIGFGQSGIELQHLYRTLDLLSEQQDSLKKHLFTTQQSLFSTKLDVVFYDVTTLYFDSQELDPESLRQKGYCKDGKAHKTHIVLGLLVDKLRNPITYHIYKGNKYEGDTMVAALKDLKAQYNIDNVIAVADSAMINQENRGFIESTQGLDYIIGDRIKSLPTAVTNELLKLANHKSINYKNHGKFTYTTLEYKERTIICTFSEKRARKDKHEREKLIIKATQLLKEPSKLKQKKKRGAGRFIKQDAEENYSLDIEKIKDDEKWDGYKAISTTADISVQEVLEKYSDLIEVEHAFRTLKSQLEIRPMFHWTNKRIEGHIAMCFIAYTMLNYVRLTTGIQNRDIIRALDQMQLSEIQEKEENQTFYLRSKLTETQAKIIEKIKIIVPKDTTPQSAINQYFT